VIQCEYFSLAVQQMAQTDGPKLEDTVQLLAEVLLQVLEPLEPVS
jgi:hypothetical protein